MIYETLHDLRGTLVAAHQDPADDAQSFKIGEFDPWIGTTATVSGSAAKILPQTGGAVVDTVEYHNLRPATEYRLEGMVVHVAADGTITPTGITSTGTFSTIETHGHTDITFDITAAQAVDYAGEKLVVYETLFDAAGKKGAEHRDPGDPAQTFQVFLEEEEVPKPRIATTVAIPGSPAKELPLSGGQVVDTVEYENLQPNTTYHLEGEIKQVTAAGRVNSANIFAEATLITPAAPVGRTLVSGSTTVTFEVSAASARHFRGEKLVVFETLFDAKGQLVAEHHDPEDPKQTFNIDNPDTPPLSPPVLITKSIKGPKSAEIKAQDPEFQVRASWIDGEGKTQSWDILLKPGIPRELLGLPVNTEITLDEIGARPHLGNIRWADVRWSGSGVVDEAGQSTSATLLIKPGTAPVEISLLNKTSSRGVLIIPVLIPPILPPAPGRTPTPETTSETPPAPEVSTIPDTSEAPASSTQMLPEESPTPTPSKSQEQLANTGANVAVISLIALILLAAGAWLGLRVPKRKK